MKEAWAYVIAETFPTPERKRVVTELCKIGKDTWFKLAVVRALGRMYIDTQKVRVAFEKRYDILIKQFAKSLGIEVKKKASLRDLEKAGVSIDILRRLHELKEKAKAMRKSEAWFADLAVSILSEHHLLVKWCEAVNGLGRKAALLYASYLNPVVCNTAGKARAYSGFLPGLRLETASKLRRTKVAWEVKGKFRFLADAVVMKKDDYYYTLFITKKNYYLENSRESWDPAEEKLIKWPSFKEIIEDPTVCPMYESCEKKRRAKATRLGRKPKPPACRKHLNAMAATWLGSVLISNAAELMRVQLGLDVSTFRAHKNYIPPKPFPGGEPYWGKYWEKL